MDHALPISYAFPAYPYSYSVNACEHLPLPVPLGFPTEQKLVEVFERLQFIQSWWPWYAYGPHRLPHQTRTRKQVNDARTSSLSYEKVGVPTRTTAVWGKVTNSLFRRPVLPGLPSSFETGRCRLQFISLLTAMKSRTMILRDIKVGPDPDRSYTATTTLMFTSPVRLAR